MTMGTLVGQRRFTTIDVVVTDEVASVRFDRPRANNSIDRVLLSELHEVFDLLDASEVRVIVLRGDEHAFCTGMDFNAYTAGVDRRGIPGAGQEERLVTEMTRSYMDLLRKMSLHRCVVVSVVEGKALAGGIGIVAASDYAIASEQSTFGLPEVIWGLLPSMAVPYLIRRVGHQAAYRMTMLGHTIDARRAAAIDLVDECVAPEELDRALDLLLRQLGRMYAPVVPLMKRYFRDLSAITDEVEEHAVRTTTERSRDERVKANIANFTRHGRFPWSPK
nr:enoyl-CoA hydratase-related protein [Brooklawnia cerclae]